MTAGAMTLIEVRPHRWGWQVYEAPGVQPVFLSKEQAIAASARTRRFHARVRAEWDRQRIRAGFTR
jgi:hypothetical protein